MSPLPSTNATGTPVGRATMLAVPLPPGNAMRRPARQVGGRLARDLSLQEIIPHYGVTVTSALYSVDM